MNYFAHGRRFIDDPYFLAGTAVPDWLCVVGRHVKVRTKHAEPFADDADPRVAALAHGIAQHHRDDAWFHETRAFTELSWQLTVTARDALPAEDGFRPSFLGHILVEILLDAELIAHDPARLSAYYAAMERLDAAMVHQAVSRMAPRPVEQLDMFVRMFCREQFLRDYADDSRLLYRLNQVMRRVNLPALPDSFCEVFPAARATINRRAAELVGEAPVAAAG